jgi:type IV pilus assembly protein PilW
MARSENRNAGGFTLIELLVSISIGMVVLAAVSTTFMSQARFYSAQEQINEMEQNARGALDIITRELKMAGYNPAGASFDGVTYYNSSQLQIKADLNGVSGIQDNTNENVTYAYNNSNLQITRTLGGGTAQVLADNITAVTFTCYKADGNTTTTTSSEIRQVKIDITATTAKPDPNYSANGGHHTYQVTATITPLNLAL